MAKFGNCIDRLLFAALFLHQCLTSSFPAVYSAPTSRTSYSACNQHAAYNTHVAPTLMGPSTVMRDVDGQRGGGVLTLDESTHSASSVIRTSRPADGRLCSAASLERRVGQKRRRGDTACVHVSINPSSLRLPGAAICAVHAYLIVKHHITLTNIDPSQSNSTVHAGGAMDGLGCPKYTLCTCVPEHRRRLICAFRALWSDMYSLLSPLLVSPFPRESVQIADDITKSTHHAWKYMFSFSHDVSHY